MKRRVPRFVPSLVFTSAVASVVPACGGEFTTTDEDGGSGRNAAGRGGSGAKPSGSGGQGHGGAGKGGSGGVEVIVLAIGGFTGGDGGRPNAGGRVGYGGVIPLAIAGFTGRGGSVNTGGVTGSGGTKASGGTTSSGGFPGIGGVIVLAIAGFTGGGGTTATGGTTSAGGASGKGGTFSAGGTVSTGGAGGHGGTGGKLGAGGKFGTGGITIIVLAVAGFASAANVAPASSEPKGSSGEPLWNRRHVVLPHQTPVRRILSETPLARSYELSLLGDARKRRPIPWQSFERARYPEPALELAGDAHARLAEGEYHAVGLFGRISSGIAMVPAPFDIVAASTRISSDEIRHADYCTRFASLCLGHEITLAVDRGALAAAAPALPGLDEADFLVAKYAATGETLAAALLLACRRRAKDPLARALFSTLLGDEIAHARFGWYYLAWRTPHWTTSERQAVADHLGEFVASIERALWFGRDAPASARAAADALGVLDSESQREVVRQVMEEEIVPGLDALGLGASHAWRVRARGPATVASPRRRDELVFGAGEPIAKRPERPEDTATQVVNRAAAWLASRITDTGVVEFSLDARTKQSHAVGPLQHGRAAIAIRALASHGGHPRAVERAAMRLRADINAALVGAPVEGWPDDPALVAATLALVSLAGIDVKDALAAAASAPEVSRTPWYAAQVCTALGRAAPEVLWAACIRGLDGDSWAPWTAMAARARGDAAVYERCETELVQVVGEDGAVVGPQGPEIARTAATVEALEPFVTPSARHAAERACGFLARKQLAEVGEPLHVGSIDGAFPLVPDGDLLRTDATAHALLAFLAWERKAHGS